MLVIPDIHGRPFWQEAKDYDGEIIFLGDYPDPYGYEFSSFADIRGWGRRKKVIENMLDIFNFARENQDRVTVLVGNHCYQYIANVQTCSRYDKNGADEISKVYADNMDILRMAKAVGNTLFTHGILFQEWHKLRIPEANTLQEIETALNKMLEEKSHYLYDVDWTRWGEDEISGPLWGDTTEQEEFKGVRPFIPQIFTGFAQIVGHTMIQKEGEIWKHEEAPLACIDSRRIFEVDPYLAPNEVINSLKIWGNPVDWAKILGKATPEVVEKFDIDENGEER